MAINLDDLNSTAGANDKSIDPFDAPVAGQSLTDEPNKWTWERPAKFSTPTEALGFFMMRLNEDKIFNSTLNLMYGGVTIESITKVLTFNAFSEGLITPDVAELINPYLFLHLLSLAKKAGIKARLLNNPTREIDPVALLHDLRPEDAKKLLKESEDFEGSQELTKGFMAMQEDEPKMAGIDSSRSRNPEPLPNEGMMPTEGAVEELPTEELPEVEEEIPTETPEDLEEEELTTTDEITEEEE